MFYKIYCRLYQAILRVASYFLKWRFPEVFEGQGSISKIKDIISKEKIKKVLIVTDKGIISNNLLEDLLKNLKDINFEYCIYDNVVPNPTIQNVEEGYKIYKENQCSAIIAIGGGSVIDCAKGIGVKVIYPKKQIEKFKGLLKVRKKLPPLIAIPTTAGTGSETTITIVISNPLKLEKYSINDTVLIPKYAILDPILIKNLPPHLTATTGMDALTHAIEAYIGRSNTKKTKQYALEAIDKIFKNLPMALDSKNIEAKNQMLKASFLAGKSFTRAYVGYVHAISHSLSALYNLPHGFVNAIVLPVVLESYGKAIYSKMKEIAIYCGISTKEEDKEEATKRIIEKIKEFNKNFSIPSTIDKIVESDIPKLVEKAYKEANPFYPVPKIFSKKELNAIYKKLLIHS